MLILRLIPDVKVDRRRELAVFVRRHGVLDSDQDIANPFPDQCCLILIVQHRPLGDLDDARLTRRRLSSVRQAIDQCAEQIDTTGAGVSLQIDKDADQVRVQIWTECGQAAVADFRQARIDDLARLPLREGFSPPNQLVHAKSERRRHLQLIEVRGVP